VRIALTEPAELDDEALGWLRLACEQNTAPLPVVIEALGLPGRSFCAGPGAPTFRNVHLALRSTSEDRPGLTAPGHPWRATEPVPGDAASARWQVDVTIRRGADGLDFGGPFVRGDRTDRHLALAWGDVSADGTFRLFRGAKLRLLDLDPGLVEEAMRPGAALAVRIRFTDELGQPIRPAEVTWSAVQPLGAGKARSGTTGQDRHKLTYPDQCLTKSVVHGVPDRDH
jgi:hypothetical protein